MEQNNKTTCDKVLDVLAEMRDENIIDENIPLTYENFKEYFGEDGLDELSKLSSEDKHKILMWLTNYKHVFNLDIDFYNLFCFTHDDLNNMKDDKDSIVEVFDRKVDLFNRIVKSSDDGQKVERQTIVKAEHFFTNDDIAALK